MENLFSLTGRAVELVPLSLDLVPELIAAATEDRNSFGFTTVPPDRAAMEEYVERALAKRESGDQCPFATWSVGAQRFVGSTRFYDLAPWDWSAIAPAFIGRQRTDQPDVASIGHTWLHPIAQRTAVNSEAKLLMLTHAFDVWGVRAVRFHTDARNARSRTAIERLGCTLDGVIRCDRPASDGGIRDTAVFTLLADEWPDHRARLAATLAR